MGRVDALIHRGTRPVRLQRGAYALTLFLGLAISLPLGVNPAAHPPPAAAHDVRSVQGEPPGSVPTRTLGHLEARHATRASGQSSLHPTDSPGRVVATLPVGNSPEAIALDASRGWVYVANAGSSTVSAFNGTVSQGSTVVGTSPESLLFDPGHGLLYVANAGSGNVTVVQALHNAADVSVGLQPFGLALDNGSNSVFVLNGGSANVSVLSGLLVVRSVAVGDDPYAAVYDAADGFVYVTDRAAGSVTILSGTAVIGNVSVGQEPSAALYDAVDHDVYVANEASSNVSILAGTSLVGTVAVPGEPYSMAADPASGRVFVASIGSPAYATVLNETNSSGSYSLGENVALGGSADLTFDPVNGMAYLAAYSDDRISALTASGVFGSVGVGRGPIAVLWDPTHHWIECVNSGSANVSVLDPVPRQFAVNFSESTLPAGARWSVTFNGTTRSSTASTIGFFSANGSGEPFAIASVAGFTPVTPSGTVDVPGRAVDLLVSFTANRTASSVLWFNETGLPPSTNWSVTVIGEAGFAGSTSAAADGPSISFTLPAAFTGEYRLRNVSGYHAQPANGSIDAPAGGGPVAFPIRFSANQTAMVPLTIEETGLPPGTAWSVSVNGSRSTSENRSIILSVRVGTEPFSVAAVPSTAGTYEPSPSAGEVNVSGPNGTLLRVHFTLYYTVTFAETGLPAGTLWSVTLAGVGRNSSTPTIAFSEPNGTYGYAVGSADGVQPTPSNGSISVDGLAATIPVGFGPAGGGGPAGFLGVPDLDWLALSLVVLGAIAAVWVDRQRRPPTGTSETGPAVPEP